MAKVSLTTPGKIVLAALVAGIAGLTLWKTGALDRSRVAGTGPAVPDRITLPDAGAVGAASSAPPGGAFAMPSRTPLPPGPAHTNARMLVWAWNSQMGMMFANGGAVTTEGSLMAQKGVRLSLKRQDDGSVMQQELVSCARELASGKKECDSGAHYVAIMGDGGAAFLRGLNAELAKLGADLVGEVVGSAGFSRGEDKFMGPPSWRADPKAARGGVVAGVLRDGDWNIAMFWASNNGICNNPDPQTYDPNCLNWVGTNSYLEPVEKYNQKACEERPVLANGRPSGQRRKVCVDAVVTWTPGDVNVLRGRGGLVSILSTRDGENVNQMPHAIIGLRRWNRAHREAVVGMLAAVGAGGQAVQSDAQALSEAARISDEVYGEAGTGPMYWETYYRGRDEVDRVTSQHVLLGGSKANNLADMLQLFGLTPGAANVFEATYTAFGNVVRQQYPRDVPDFPAFAQVSDTSYLQDAAKRAAAAVGTAEQPKFTAQAAEVAKPIMRRSWTITFHTNSADFTPAAQATLRELQAQLLVAGGTYVDVHGYTDNVGPAEPNKALSQRRAEAVQAWLAKSSSLTFPAERVRTFGHGADAPVGDNTTEQGRSQNRRVEVALRAAN
jgi:outer membrane protein OmpA-like peptidoglycan-associated protein